MKTQGCIIVAIHGLVMISPIYAQGSNASIGVGVSEQQSIYKDVDDKTGLLPILSYEGEHFFFQGLTAGYKIMPANSPSNIVVKIKYDLQSFDPKDSTDAQLRQLNKRDGAVMGGVSYQINTPVGLFQTGVLTDISDEHNGTSAELLWTMPATYQGWNINTTVGYVYSNSKLNNYYYGVSAAESAVSGLPAYDLDWNGYYIVSIQSFRMVTSNIAIGGGINSYPL
ncbi:MipA/OmpV family protein [Vibrio sp. PP-XX7]